MAQVSLTVVGSLAVDRVDGGPASPGGCPSFVGAVLAQLSATPAPDRSRLPATRTLTITRRSPRDAALFDAMLAGIAPAPVVLDSAATSAFELVYSGERREMTVIALGEPWLPSDFQTDPIESHWVHLAPLLRSDFPVPTVAALAAGGRRICFDGQGLVRAARLGPMVTDSAFDPAVLEHLSVLKLADEEAAVLAGGEQFTEADAARLGVPEILVTFGSAGADVYLDAVRIHVSSNRSVQGIHTTGSGDMFAVSYAAARAAAVDPVQAATAACELVADVLERRRDG